MQSDRPYLTFSHPTPGPASFLMKKAAEKNADLMRSLTVTEHREAIELLAGARLIAPGGRYATAEEFVVPCEWVFGAESPADKVILYLHGGSWAWGSLRTARPVGAMLSAVSGYRVLVAEYRLAPENPFPAGADDCAGIYRRLLELGYPPQGIALFGDSAGGNLSLSLLHRLGALGLPLPAAVGLASPATDMSESSELFRRMPDLLYTHWQGVEQDAFSLYCGDNDRRNPLISPCYGDLTGLPPMLIHVGQDEELCIDCDLFAAKAHQAGVDVALKIWRGMYHDFTIVGVTLKESRRSLKEFGAFFKQHLG